MQIAKFLKPQMDTEEFMSFLKKRSLVTRKEVKSIFKTITTSFDKSVSLSSNEWIALWKIFLTYSKKEGFDVTFSEMRALNRINTLVERKALYLKIIVK